MNRVRELLREPAALGRVPRLVHQIWIQGADQVPAKYDGARAAWRAQMRVETWSGAELAEVVAALLPELADWFPRQKVVVQSDVGRIALLALLGGIYADMDYVPVKSFERCLAHAERPWLPHVFIIGCTPIPGDSFNNAMIASTRGNPVWAELVLPHLRETCHARAGLQYALNPMLEVMEIAGPRFWTDLKPELHWLKYGATVLTNMQVHGNILAFQDQKRVPTAAEMDELERKGCFGFHWYEKSWNEGALGGLIALFDNQLFLYLFIAGVAGLLFWGVSAAIGHFSTVRAPPEPLAQ